ncbi:small ribosomal subunit protein uS15m [Hippocampus comes]|uniref:small ribosomal subunit protein uS15m n=1 Tax=Hippocampus comes TaxID=109280 RepID=UPI00094E209F|nr:PREDICTED: 28S ribosomal protein S15, mitochondrial [Hippocampus comes]
MLSNITLRTILLRSSVVALRESAAAPPRTGCSASLSPHKVSGGKKVNTETLINPMMLKDGRWSRPSAHARTTRRALTMRNCNRECLWVLNMIISHKSPYFTFRNKMPMIVLTCISKGSVGPPAPVRHYARLSKTKEAGPESQLADLPSTSLKMDYAAVPLAQTTDDVVKRLLSLELASHSEKLALKKEQLIAKVQRDEGDRNSVEVRVAILTARIRNFQEHLLKHHKVSRENSHMRRRKGFLSDLERIDAFPSCCVRRTQDILRSSHLHARRSENFQFSTRIKIRKYLLGITYTFPPEYYRRATRRWLAKKAFCLKVFKEVQKQKAEQKLKLQPHQSAEAAQAPTASR